MILTTPVPDVPLWIPGEGRPAGGGPKRRIQSPYYKDYVALAHIWHEMRTLVAPAHIGFGHYRLKEDLLLEDEVLFMRRHVMTRLNIFQKK